MSDVNIKKIRASLGLTQTEFAEMLGVKLRAMQTWESGERNIPKTARILIDRIINAQNAYSIAENKQIVKEPVGRYEPECQKEINFLKDQIRRKDEEIERLWAMISPPDGEKKSS